MTARLANLLQVRNGYNPKSWNSAGSYNYSHADADRTAFLFNLTTDVLQRQKLTANSTAGVYQTFSNSSAGPTFGGGYDLWTSDNLQSGKTYQYSYGPVGRTTDFGTGDTITIEGYLSNDFQVGRIEVYTFADAAAAVPEPGTLALSGFGIVGMIGGWYRKRRKTTVAA